MKSILNVSAYKFVSLSEPSVWRDAIRAQAQACQLRGTVLLAEEGINLFMAGSPEDMQSFLRWLRAQEPFAGLVTKESESGKLPFGKLIVKTKPEIIRMNHPMIRPQNERAPAVDAQTLARWLSAGHDDAGRQVLMLDTRNAFEVDHGRFTGAHDWRTAKFSDFPAALLAHRDELIGKTVVSYCTGGIRCEKAALLMREAGIENVLQLEGGILQYFKEVGGRHFEGACFVFDERTALSDTLASTLPLYVTHEASTTSCALARQPDRAGFHRSAAGLAGACRAALAGRLPGAVDARCEPGQMAPRAHHLVLRNLHPRTV